MLDQPPKTHFAFARVHRVMMLSYLRTQEAHARRSVPTAELRPQMQQAACLFWSAFGSPTGDLVGDYQKMKAQLGARERRGAALCLHMLIGISPGWIERMGDLHDPRNVRVQQLFQVARDFCDRHFNGVFNLRMDLDERGGGVVDVFATHAHERQARLRKRGDRGPSVTELSVKTALDEMSRLSGANKSFVALQTLWAEFARDRLDAGILRGVPKEVTGREHLSTAEFRQVAEREREVAERRRGLMLTMANTYPVIDEIANAQMQLQIEQDARGKAQDRRAIEIDAREEAYAVRSRELEARQRETEAREVELDRAFAAAEAIHSDAGRRAAKADAAALRNTALERQLRAGLSMIAKGALTDPQELENWPETELVRPLLMQAMSAVDIRTATERRSLKQERLRLTDHRRVLDDGNDAIAARTISLDKEQAAITARSEAYKRGLSLIASGKIATRADIDADPGLAPAVDLVAEALHGLMSTIVHLRTQSLEAGSKAAQLLDNAATVSVEASARMKQADHLFADATLRQQAVETEEDRLAVSRAKILAHAAAWRAGLLEIEAGTLRSAGDIAGRPDLAPAASELIGAMHAVAIQVDQRAHEASNAIARTIEEQRRLTEDRQQAQVARRAAMQAESEAKRLGQDAVAARAHANAIAVEANQMQAKVRGLLSSVSTFVKQAATLGELPASVAPTVKALTQAYDALIEQRGRGSR